MNIDAHTLSDILVKGSYITEDDAKRALDALATRGITFKEYLLTEGLVNNDLMGQAIAEYYGVPYTDLKAMPISAKQVRAIPEELAKKYHIVVVSREGNTVMVATDDPSNSEIIPALEHAFPRRKFTLSYALSEDIDTLFLHYQKPLDTRFSQIIEKSERVAPELLEEIFEDALTYKASDIHFEPQENEILIRFRVDGVLHEAGRVPKEYYENILNRIKVQSGLRIDEHFSAQDGALRYEKHGRTVDMRTSITPTVTGEKVVMRVLAAYVQGLTLSDLGLSAYYQDMMREAAEKPFGMILVVGPTGSGKTTTLYAVLKLLNNPDVNITTIEDPVEYKMRGVNQIQVNMQTNLTFAQGLRSIVRQDPDIILVGEIRDQETAEIGINAALTGHLLLSTFHANDASTAIPRLSDMGVEPFLLASTLEVIVAQRLVRKICSSCRHTVAKHESDFNTTQLRQAHSYFPEGTIFYEGKGCDACGHTGFKGRTALFEFIRMTPKLQELVIGHPSAQDIWKLASEEGSLSLFEDGIDKVRNGITTIEELLRVAEPPRYIKHAA